MPIVTRSNIDAAKQRYFLNPGKFTDSASFSTALSAPFLNSLSSYDVALVPSRDPYIVSSPIQIKYSTLDKYAYFNFPASSQMDDCDEFSAVSILN